MKKIYIWGFFFILSLIFIGAASFVDASSCGYHVSQRCMGSNLYWTDSCGNIQDRIGPCSDFNNFNVCTSRAYRFCVGNDIYWFDSCGNRQTLDFSCSFNQVCKYSQCVATPVQPAPQPSYVARYRVACSNNSLYWFDSVGRVNSLYKNCNDNNTCSIDSCSAGKCLNTKKCDGSTCVVDSADYRTHCSGAPAPVTCQNGQCEPDKGETFQNCPSDCGQAVSDGQLLLLFQAAENLNAAQGKTSVSAGPNDSLYFMISVANNSAQIVNNVMVSANIPVEVATLGNLQINGEPFAGDIVSGINIGTLAASEGKVVTFEGRTENILATAVKEAIAKVNISGAEGGAKTGTISINFAPDQGTAGVAPAEATSGFLEFLKRWYLWIIAGLVIVFLFIIVFKRVSSEG